MKISSVNNLYSFGKNQVMKCITINNETQNTHVATLYRMDTDNPKDYEDVKYSKYAVQIKDSFYKARINGNSEGREFYLLQNDKNGEVISCASSTHHYRNSDMQNSGKSTIVEEFAVNNKYQNPAQPMLAYIIKHAEDRLDKSVYFIDTDDEMPEYLSNAGFKEGEEGGIYYLSEDKFKVYTDASSKEININFEA